MRHGLSVLIGELECLVRYTLHVQDYRKNVDYSAKDRMHKPKVKNTNNLAKL